MTKPLKVFIANLDGTHDSIVAAKNRTEAAKAFGISMYAARQWMGEAANHRTRQVALSDPGVVYQTKINYGPTETIWEKRNEQ